MNPNLQARVHHKQVNKHIGICLLFFPAAALLRSFLFTVVSEMLIHVVSKLYSSDTAPVGMTIPVPGAVACWHFAGRWEVLGQRFSDDIAAEFFLFFFSSALLRYN